MENNGRAVERAIAVTMFIIQIAAIALSYGALKQQVSDLNERVLRIERYVDGKLDHR